jgi:hypothetical protein
MRRTTKDSEVWMKLLLCENCWDVFKLDYDMRICKCGKIKGRYINNSQAEVSKNAVSLALGNGSVQQSISNMRVHHMETNGKAERYEYYQPNNGKIEYAWVRPNEGVGNPHTKVIEE